MKLHLLFLILSMPLASHAQELVATHPSVTYRVGSEKASLYRTPADTANKSKWFLSPGEEAYVVGEFSPRWAVVKRTGTLYLPPARNLADYNSARVKSDRAADAAGMPIDPQTHLITYQGVVEVPSVNKADLYTRAYAWIAKTYRSANDVIQMQDKEAGQLVAKGLTQVQTKSMGMTFDAGVVRHTLTIYVKDGRFKYVLTNLTHEAAGAPNIQSVGPLESQNLPFGDTKRFWADVKQDANRDAYRLVAELQTAMTLKGTKDPSDF
jgi:hypothetical protein